MNRVIINVQLTEEAAEALAQFVKRAGYSDCRNNAKSEEEAYLMLDGLIALRNNLAEAGFAPR